jgi:2-phospho-L-lactate guanylyltransferase (CobY/MobA/RfbA family)
VIVVGDERRLWLEGEGAGEEGENGVGRALEEAVKAVGLEIAVTTLGRVDVSEPDELLQLLQHAREAEVVLAPRGSPATLALLLAEPAPPEDRGHGSSDGGGDAGGRVVVFAC